MRGGIHLGSVWLRDSEGLSDANMLILQEIAATRADQGAVGLGRRLEPYTSDSAIDQLVADGRWHYRGAADAHLQWIGVRLLRGLCRACTSRRRCPTPGECRIDAPLAS